jgi:hypothetical protein
MSALWQDVRWIGGAIIVAFIVTIAFTDTSVEFVLNAIEKARMELCLFLCR